MIINTTQRVEYAIPFSGGWVCEPDNDIIFIDYSGKVEKYNRPGDFLNLAYDEANRQPVIVVPGGRVCWSPPKVSKKRRRINIDYELPFGGSRFGNYFAVPGSFVATDFRCRTKEGLKRNREESKELIIFGSEVKIIGLPMIVENACFSHDGLSILASGVKGFAVVDNPFA